MLIKPLHSIHIKVEEKYYVAIAAKAKKKGLTVTGYCRMQILKSLGGK